MNFPEIPIEAVLESLKPKCTEIKTKISYMEQAIQNYNIFCNDIYNIDRYLQNSNPANNMEQTRKATEERQLISKKLEKEIELLCNEFGILTQWLQKTCTEIENTLDKVMNIELPQWKREQQLNGNGAQMNCNLDVIQFHCEKLAEVIWDIRQCIYDTQRFQGYIKKYLSNTPDVLPDLLTQITKCLSNLITSSFIIEHQPPQVMKTNTRFNATVRFLIGIPLNLQLTPPEVKADIIYLCENQTLKVQSNKIDSNNAIETRGEILNNCSRMEIQSKGKIFSANLRNMQLKKIKRSERNGSGSVMDEKFFIYFTSQFSIGGGQILSVGTLSLPIVVIVHGNQEPHAQATITWDNAFANFNRPSFSALDKKPWPLVAEVLKMKFESATGGQLNADCLQFLGEKVFRTKSKDLTNEELSWTLFARDHLPDRDFTFWDWFYAAMKLTKEHLREMWCDNLVMGFVGKEDATVMLKGKPQGTFLLRFSDSALGGITIACIDGNNDVFMIQPRTAKILVIQKLADTIRDLSELLYLYPDHPKDITFMHHYSRKEPPKNTAGYVVPVLETKIPNSSSSQNNSSHPAIKLDPNQMEEDIHSEYDARNFMDDIGDIASSPLYSELMDILQNEAII